MIPPKANGEFTAHMEQVLETYAQPYDERFPVLCMDEQPLQLLEETNLPIAATKDHARRVDYEYGRAGTASIFMFAELLAKWRSVQVRERRTKASYAVQPIFKRWSTLPLDLPRRPKAQLNPLPAKTASYMQASQRHF